MDTEFLVGAQNGDQRGFASLTEAIDGRFHSVAFGVLRDIAPAEDAPDHEFNFSGGFAAPPDGSLWVAIHGPEQLLRCAGSTFRSVGPVIANARCITHAVPGLHGEVWTFVVSDPPALARDDGTSWAIPAPDPDIPAIQASGGHGGTVVVAPDGRLWSTGSSADQVAVIGRSDGTTWTDVDIHDGGLDPGIRIKTAPDGTVLPWTKDGFLIVDPEVAMGHP